MSIYLWNLYSAPSR